MKLGVIIYGLLILTSFTSPIRAQIDCIPDSAFVNKEFKNLNLDSEYQNGNWNPVLKKLKDKIIVLLGEPNHGSGEIFDSRNDLIKSLHEKLGFDVILFESGIGELAAIHLQREDLTARQMTNGLLGGWRTKEFVELMEYAKSNNISISGFDVQRTGGSFEELLLVELDKSDLKLPQFDNLEQEFTKEKARLTNRKTAYDSVKDSTPSLIRTYELLLEKLKNQSSQNDDLARLFVIRTIENRVSYLRYFLDFVRENDWRKRWETRDYMMYSNISWLLKSVYKGEKVIVVAHNFHISKFNKNEQVMGEFLKEEFGSKMYSIGVFAGKGEYFDNFGRTKSLMTASKNNLDIKHIIDKLNGRAGFLNIPKKSKKGFCWLFRNLIVNDTFIDLDSTNELVLSKHFDGLVFIDRITPPEKL